jgi:hypothetical protein
VKFNEYPSIILDSKPTVCCRTYDNKFLFINLDGEILETETSYSETPDSYIFKVGNGTLKYEQEIEGWQYIANPALKTKPAIHE